MAIQKKTANHIAKKKTFSFLSHKVVMTIAPSPRLLYCLIITVLLATVLTVRVAYAHTISRNFNDDEAISFNEKSTLLSTTSTATQSVQQSNNEDVTTSQLLFADSNDEDFATTEVALEDTKPVLGMTLSGSIENHTGKDWKLVKYHASKGFISSVSNNVERNWQGYFNAQASSHKGSVIGYVVYKVLDSDDMSYTHESQLDTITIRYKLTADGTRSYTVRNITCSFQYHSLIDY